MMLLTTFLAVVVAVAFGVALAPAVRKRLALAIGTIWLLIVFAGWMWPDLARELGLWTLAIILALIGASAGVLVKLFQWYDRFVVPPSDTVDPRGPRDNV
jgi:ABC-type proline/glycine betaine transport system permease subunit